jgi:uncharacterized protein (TIGR02246 family)
MRNRLVPLLALLALGGLTARHAWAADAKPNGKEEMAILKKAEAFVEAFHTGDAKAVASHWAEDGDYTDQRGRTFKGRAAIEKIFKELFAENKGLKVRINIDSIRFVTPEVAIEDGTTEVLPPKGGPPSRSRYTIVHVKKDGEWLVSSVRDAIFVSPTNYDHLRALEWAIGEWVAEAETGEGAHLTFTWAPHQNYIINTFMATFKNVSLGSGTQWIGWDPRAKTIRVWTFEEAGGFGEGVMTKVDNKLQIKVTLTQRDGTKVTATNIVTPIDRDTVTWESRERTADGKAVPDIKPIKLKRVK